MNNSNKTCPMLNSIFYGEEQRFINSSNLNSKTFFTLSCGKKKKKNLKKKVEFVF